MRPSHHLLALGAASVATAAQLTSECTWPTPSPNVTGSMTTLSTTDEITYTSWSPITTAAPTTNTTTTTTLSTSSAAATVSHNNAPVDGLSGDSSVLGLVVFFALSLCLL